MMTLAMVSLLVGIVLGQRFNVLVLVPTIAIALVLAIAVAGADVSWWLVLRAAAAATSLQIGYFIGIGIRNVVPAARESRSPAISHGFGGGAPHTNS
jgi:hypothetical protein